ncbi:hypothetical protein SAMN05192574_105229 [Mucilaginibacter gossypiicola]|uniref:Uncharacterized protein n=1 Tax=Mucilaginibacter gossypiicola TaxID=551995 RepID=A0A1H8LSG9_9SPHI|nr:hypothetical protein [Mucilaginibacter gossypiicola]SEO08040.1 hypothetical protein SAMN05192574_105229 [Mucilaginibacter gossypiicola]
MHIIDLHGKKITVVNLQLAILQADDYRHYQLGGTAYAEFNRKQEAYWEDFYIKLLLLENELNHNKQKPAP